MTPGGGPPRGAPQPLGASAAGFQKEPAGLLAIYFSPVRPVLDSELQNDQVTRLCCSKQRTLSFRMPGQ